MSIDDVLKKIQEAQTLHQMIPQIQYILAQL